MPVMLKKWMYGRFECADAIYWGVKENQYSLFSIIIENNIFFLICLNSVNN
jgi:hypothetical protein